MQSTVRREAVEPGQKFLRGGRWKNAVGKHEVYIFKNVLFQQNYSEILRNFHKYDLITAQEMWHYFLTHSCICQRHNVRY